MVFPTINLLVFAWCHFYVLVDSSLFLLSSIAFKLQWRKHRFVLFMIQNDFAQQNCSLENWFLIMFWNFWVRSSTQWTPKLPKQISIKLQQFWNNSKLREEKSLPTKKNFPDNISFSSRTSIFSRFGINNNYFGNKKYFHIALRSFSTHNNNVRLWLFTIKQNGFGRIFY